jgi:hypothetical protein
MNIASEIQPGVPARGRVMIGSPTRTFSTAQRRYVHLEALHVLAHSPYESNGLVDDPYREHQDAEERQAKVLGEWRARYPGVAVTSVVRGGPDPPARGEQRQYLNACHNER